MNPPQAKAILFDNDGVLVASEPLHWSAWERLLKNLGLPYSEAEIRGLVGRTSPEILADILNRHRPGWNRADFDLQKLSQEKNDLYLEIARTSLTPYPGVLEGLRWLKSRGIRAAVVSNARRREIEAAIGFAGLAPWIDLVASRDDVSAPKPDPSMYLFASASFELDPDECIAIEDSPTGLEAALTAGIPTAAVLTNFPRSAVETPVPGRPDLRPRWILGATAELFKILES